ncbi:hypothetical protein Tco_0327342 [Tanacetum coccineum]
MRAFTVGQAHLHPLEFFFVNLFRHDGQDLLVVFFTNFPELVALGCLFTPFACRVLDDGISWRLGVLCRFAYFYEILGRSCVVPYGWRQLVSTKLAGLGFKKMNSLTMEIHSSVFKISAGNHTVRSVLITPFIGQCRCRLHESREELFPIIQWIIESLPYGQRRWVRHALLCSSRSQCTSRLLSLFRALMFSLWLHMQSSLLYLVESRRGAVLCGSRLALGLVRTLSVVGSGSVARCLLQTQGPYTSSVNNKFKSIF